ncbi:MAG TPA: NADH-quinone oxidoreductase subunit NuoH [Planctomycetaceae bacterium]|nr:NADH-quinone oxidoreductase subunit NuoH [Planctomycetaceae bacterium]HQZ64352.1 NADH-quinone oxidoreductase subunit NuoH [Planctomycetaceae bacterium]
MPEILITLLTIGVVVAAIPGVCNYLILLERKLSAWMQDRIGPNRVGPMGLFQPIADGIKLLLKEEVIPPHVDKVLFIIAPAISVFTAMMAFAVVPFGPVNDATVPSFLRFIIAPNIDIGVVFIFAIGSLGVYGVVLGGWASNNKYSALGAMRASAQVVSYEIPLGMSVLGIALLSGTLNLEKIMHLQTAGGLMNWNIWFQPLAALMFFTASLAEANRLPFDLAECEQELIGGWHTEYSALKWALFFLGEYTHMITISFLTAILFLGGWSFPFIAEATSNYTGLWLVKLLVLISKAFFFICVMIMLRWTLPRFRFDQLMELAWKVMIPLSLANVVMVMFCLQFQFSRWWLLPGSAALCAAWGTISAKLREAELAERPGYVKRKKSAPAVAQGHVAGHH